MADQDMQNHSPFGPIHIVDPSSTYTHTVVCLHGRGSDGPEFADEFLASPLSGDMSITQRIPGTRWVFPSSPSSWSEVFQEQLPAWFDARSLTDITARQNLQISGLTSSVAFVQNLLDDEVSKLAGDYGKVFLGGISQGGAVGLWTLLCRPQPLGGFFAASTWLPFAENMDRIMIYEREEMNDTREAEMRDEFDAFVRSMIDFKQLPSRQTRALLGHGVDDAYVDISLGRQAKELMSKMGFVVRWNEYAGAEEEGHWFKVPEQMDDIIGFILEETRQIDE